MQKRLTVPINHSVQTIIQMVSVLYLMIWSVAPPLQIGLVFRLLALGLAFVWFAVEFLRRFEFTRIQIWCALFMAAVAVITYIQSGASAVLGQISTYMMVLAYFINIYSADSWRNYRVVVPITLALLILFNYRTVTMLLQNPAIARLLVRDTEELYDYMRQGVGGYGLVYQQVLIAPVVYAWTLKSFEHNKLFFVLGLAWTVSFWALIANAGYSIAVIVAVISAVVLIVYRRQSILPAFIIAVLLIAGIVFLLVYVESFRNIVLRFFEGTKVVIKIQDLVSTAEGEMADSFTSRIVRYWASIEACLQFPIIGDLLFGGSSGGHSFVLDTFARFGVWGGIPSIIMIFYSPRYFKNKSSSTLIHVTANAHILAIALVALFDSFPYQLFFPILILCPIMYFDLMSWKGEKYDNSLDG